MTSTRSAWQRAVLVLFHLSPAAAVWVCGGLFALIAFADQHTPPELNLSMFYVFVILLATWNAGLGAGMAFALASGAMQWIVMSNHAAPVLHSVYWYLWLANRWFMFIVVIALTHPLRVLFDRQQAAARIDALTEAANHKYFREILQKEITRSARSGEAFAVALVDCDGFKLINDQFGHIVGDSVLRAVVDTAKRCMRRSDTVARVGGDEFALLLPAIGTEHARQAVERFRVMLHDQNIAGQWTVTASIGLATFEAARLDPEEVIARCDALMYRAKRRGAGQIEHEHFSAPGAHGGGLTVAASTK